MSDATPPSNPTNNGEINLEDIDALLEAEDPGFTKSLEEVRAVETDQSVVIEASAFEAATDEKFGSDQPLRGWRKLRSHLRAWFVARRARLKQALIELAKRFWLWLKIKPKEYLLFSLAMLKVGFKKSLIPIVAFRNADRFQKSLMIVLMAMAGGAGWILLHNLKGIWLPAINEPILRSFDAYADFKEEFDPKEQGESFYSAFPQERHEFLFGKMKVNLRRTTEHPLPMGAFEIIVLLDSKDTAIEVRDREVEFGDLLQRVFEDESFNDLETEMGKNKLKGRLKREMNQQLTQGWVKDINFKTFVLKP